VSGFHRLLKPGGLAVVKVPPAWRCGATGDVALHQFRRYIGAVAGTFSGSEWDIIHANYTNVLVYPACGRSQMAGVATTPGRAVTPVARSEDHIPARPLNALLRAQFVQLAHWRVPFSIRREPPADRAPARLVRIRSGQPHFGAARVAQDDRGSATDVWQLFPVIKNRENARPRDFGGPGGIPRGPRGLTAGVGRRNFEPCIGRVQHRRAGRTWAEDNSMLAMASVGGTSSANLSSVLSAAGWAVVAGARVSKSATRNGRDPPAAMDPKLRFVEREHRSKFCIDVIEQRPFRRVAPVREKFDVTRVNNNAGARMSLECADDGLLGGPASSSENQWGDVGVRRGWQVRPDIVAEQSRVGKTGRASRHAAMALCVSTRYRGRR